ncbi:DUF2975 domain-containing protein [Pleionea mediterranea]|uniref:DUF2975 family protein n=1 Tax=Pleionea mediterranea TaxID=523701 RepID=A0A316FC89_9GAMM|nr:DUF2975 domain-containing protein [Pleionea mediterranea]PWK43591.1 hypothetical protein C8D97_1165 [Pleionea mediterranea]
MSARVLLLFLTLSVVLTVAVTMISAVAAIALPLLNESLLTSWSVVSGQGSEAVMVAEASQSSSVELTEGVLTVSTTTITFGFIRAMNILLVGGVVTAIIWSLRQVVSDIQSGRPFNSSSIRYLRRTGYLLALLPAWLFMEVFIRFYMFSPSAVSKADFYMTHIKFLTEDGAQYFIYPDFDMGYLVAGMFVLVIAQAFKVGHDLQLDSDEII